MTIQDPIADMLTRVRNALSAKKPTVEVPFSTHKQAICQVLVDEGYISSFEVTGERPQDKTIAIQLKYFEGQPVIASLKRVSKPSLRRYTGQNDIPKAPGFGIAILSTPGGVMTGHAASSQGYGGEVICYVS